MKQHIKLFTLISFAALLGLASCSKVDYLTDEGVHDPKTPLTTYEYLQANQYKLFDTMLLLVDRFNLRSELEASKTVFAVTDYSIARFMSARQSELRLVDESKLYTLDSLYNRMTADSIRQYFFDEVITLADAVMEPEVKQVTSKGNTPCGFSKRMWDIADLKNDGGLPNFTSTPAYGLYYTRIRGALDIPGTIPPANEADIKILCQTTGIETSSSTKDPNYFQVLHVLSNQHTFARF